MYFRKEDKTITLWTAFRIPQEIYFPLIPYRQGSIPTTEPLKAEISCSFNLISLLIDWQDNWLRNRDIRIRLLMI